MTLEATQHDKRRLCKRRVPATDVFVECWSFLENRDKQFKAMEMATFWSRSLMRKVLDKLLAHLLLGPNSLNKRIKFGF